MVLYQEQFNRPTVEIADTGILYIEVGGYMPLCGHDTTV